MYEDILTLIKSIQGILQAEFFWFKEHINKMTLKAVSKQWITNPSILYRVNEIGTLIFIIYVDDNLKFRDKPELVNIIEYINK